MTAHPAQPNPFGDRLEIAPLDFGVAREPRQGASRARARSSTPTGFAFRIAARRFETAVENTRRLLRAARSVERSQDRSYQHHRRRRGFAAAVFSRQGGGRARDRGVRTLLFDPAADADFRHRRRPAQQHRMARAPLSDLRDSGTRRLSRATRVRRRPRRAGGRRRAWPDNRIVDAVGPEIYSFRDLVRTLARALGRATLIVADAAASRVALLALHRIRARRRHADPR